MREARFAGVEASIGIVVFIIFWTFGLLGIGGALIAIATGLIDHGVGNLGAAALGVGVMVLLTWKIWYDFRLIRVIDVADDGTWIMSSVFHVVRARLGPDEPRTFTVYEKSRWILTGVPRKYKVSWAVIEAQGKTWKTCMNPPWAQREAIAMLRSWIHERS